MQRFNRNGTSPPRMLAGRAAQEARQSLLRFMNLSPARRSQTNYKEEPFRLEGDGSLRTSLSELFRGRCAFCEAIADTTPYRFRPPRDAHPVGSERDPHLYYAWLETAWENLYPICRSCSPKDPTYFPVIGKRCAIPSMGVLQKFVDVNDGSWWLPIKESPRFLDPCREKDFFSDLGADISGKLIGLSANGMATIEQFNLNRSERVHQRSARYADYWSRLMATLTERRSDLAGELLVFEDLEFGGSWQILLRGVIRDLANQSGIKPAPVFTKWLDFLRQMVARGETSLIERAFAGPRVVEARLQLQAQRPLISAIDAPSISSVSLSNFKAIESLDIDLPDDSIEENGRSANQPVPSLLVLGENAAGKSSILEAIALALSDEHARGKIRSKADFHNWVLNPKFFGSGDAGVREAGVTITLTNGARRHLKISGSQFTEENTGEWRSLPVFAYGAFRQFNQTHTSSGADRHVRNLFIGQDLPNPEKWLLSLPNARFEMVIRALRDILAVEGEFDVVERNVEAEECLVVTTISGSGAKIKTPLYAVSSGFRSVLAMTCDVMSGLMSPTTNPDFDSLKTAYGVVLIDEVEAHLHPRWKMRIMQGLRQALPKMTFIATSHDPLCLRGMNDGEVLVLQRVAGPEAASQSDLPMFVERLHKLPDVSQLRIDQLLTSDFFQMYSTDDPTFEEKMAKIADSLNRDEATLSQEEVATLDEYRRDLAQALPIGSSEAHRIAQEAVAEYLQRRRGASEQTIKTLRDQAKKRIVDALGGH